MMSRSLGHRAPLLWVVLPMIAGLVIGRWGPPVPINGLLAAASGAIGVAWWAFTKHTRVAAVAIVVAGIAVGSASYTWHRARLTTWEMLPPREALVEIRITRVFAQPDPKRASGLATIIAAEPHLRALQGQAVYFSLEVPAGQVPPTRSTVLSALGVLTVVPEDPPRDSFDGYLASAGTNFRLTRGRALATVTSASRYRQFCQQQLERFSSLLSRGVVEKRPDLAAVLRAMLLGQKHELNDEQNTLFMRSGTMHLFAISGLHIGIIAIGVQALLGLMRLPALVRFLIGHSALWLYVDITGGTPSAVRAFLMIALLDGARLLRAPGNSLAALTTSALIIVMSWPLQVFSASFQLSYGIVAALLFLGLPLADAWQERWGWFRLLPPAMWRWYHRRLDDLHRNVVSALAIGLASTLVSTLCGVLYFQIFTPAALLANVVLIPAAGMVILGGFASLVSGLLGADTLNELFNHAAVLALAMIEFTVQVAATTPGAWHTAQFSETWVGPAAFLALAGALVFGYASRWSSDRGGWWPPFAIVALTLLFGVEFGDAEAKE
jgi:competence protein ComEC